MWVGDKIYFLSDRGTEQAVQPLRRSIRRRRSVERLTDFTDFDIKFPSLGDKAIVFENGGYIYRFDLATEEGREGAGAHPRRPRRGARRADGCQQERGAATRSRRTASGRCSRPAATCSPSRRTMA